MLANKKITEIAAGQGEGPSHCELALLLYNERRSRDLLMPAGRGLWGDPAWDMLLDLFVANEEGRRVNIVSACIGGCIPTTTGLRLVGQLIDAGLVVRTIDQNDRRKGMLGLTSETSSAMRHYLDVVMRNRSAAFKSYD